MDASIPFADWGAKFLNNLHKFRREYLDVSNYLSTFAAYFTFSKAALNRKHNPLRYFLYPIGSHIGIVPPCGMLMHPLPLKVKYNGKGDAVFYCL